VEPLLRIVDELERRDEEAAAALAEIVALRAEVEATRVRAAELAAFLAGLPGALAAREADDQAAAESQHAAAAALAEAEAELARAQERGRDDARIAAERAVQHARDAVREAELWIERARRERERLEREAEARRDDAERLVAGVQKLAARLAADPRVATAPPGAPGLDGVLDWASRARGDLLLAHAGLATERDKVVREATELVASAVGEPLPGTGVAGVRERLAGRTRP
jgi:hypothetical protein